MANKTIPQLRQRYFLPQVLTACGIYHMHLDASEFQHMWPSCSQYCLQRMVHVMAFWTPELTKSDPNKRQKLWKHTGRSRYLNQLRLTPRPPRPSWPFGFVPLYYTILERFDHPRTVPCKHIIRSQFRRYYRHEERKVHWIHQIKKDRSWSERIPRKSCSFAARAWRESSPFVKEAAQAQASTGTAPSKHGAKMIQRESKRIKENQSIAKHGVFCRCFRVEHPHSLHRNIMWYNVVCILVVLSTTNFGKPVNAESMSCTGVFIDSLSCFDFNQSVKQYNLASLFPLKPRGVAGRFAAIRRSCSCT